MRLLKFYQAGFSHKMRVDAHIIKVGAFLEHLLFHGFFN